MTRTTAREIAVMLIFRLAANPSDGALVDFFDGDYYETLASEHELFHEYPDENQLAYIRRLAFGVALHLDELDAYIGKYSKNWRAERISRTATAVLRAAMFEVLYMDDIPDAASMNEAIEIAKGYEEQETVSFINGILGSFYDAEVLGIGKQSDSGDLNDSSVPADDYEDSGVADADGK